MIRRALLGAMDGAAVAVAVGALSGLVDGSRVALVPVESRLDAIRSVGLISALILLPLLAPAGALVGLALSRPRRIGPRVVAGALCALALFSGLGPLGRVAGTSRAGEAAETWRLSRPPPRLRVGDGDAPAAPVVLISLDTVRADALAHMPRLAARAEDALRYTGARAPAPWTLPSTATMLTGLSPHVHGAGRPLAPDDPAARSPLAPETATLAEALAERGYVTAGIVTNAYLSPRYGLHRGFDRYLDLSARAGWAATARRVRLLRPWVPAGAESAPRVTDAALAWHARLADGRYLLWLHYIDAHTPYVEGGAVQDPVVPCELPACFDDGRAVRRGEWAPGPAERERIRALYAQDLGALDAALDRLLERVLGGGALVVLAADHGEEFWEHGGIEHGGTLYDELLRVPLLVWAPGRGPASVTRAVDLAAIAPAVLRWVEAGDLGPLEPDAPAATTPLGPTLYGVTSGCTDGRWKRVDRDGSPPALFDLAEDPGEVRDLAREHPERVASLARCVPPATPAPNGAEAIGDAAVLRLLGYVE